MILRPVLADTNVWSASLDPSAVFQAGTIAGLIEINGELFVTVATEGVPPIGIIDDNKISAFVGTVVDELQVVPAAFQEVSGVLKSTVNVMGALDETNILESTFTSNLDVILNPKKGTFIIPAGTPLNYDDGTTLGFEVISSYRYSIVDFPGDDSTDGSGKVSIHFNRGIFITDVFDVLSVYSPGAPLYVNSDGVLTSQETTSPVVAIALQPASSINNELLFMWL